MLRLALILLLASCSSEHETEAEPSEGGEQPVLSDTAPPEPLPEGSVLAVLVSDGSDADRQTRSDRREQQRRQHEERRRAFEAECGSVVIGNGPPPSPPPTPNRPSLQSLESTYQATLVPAPVPTAGTLNEYTEWARTALTAWMGDMVVRLSTLERALGSLTAEDERVVGAAWFAHAHAWLVGSLQAVPVPEQIENDPELLRIYRSSFHDPLQPVLDKAQDALGSTPAQNPNWSHYADLLREWLASARCAFHPGRPD